MLPTKLIAATLCFACVFGVACTPSSQPEEQTQSKISAAEVQRIEEHLRDHFESAPYDLLVHGVSVIGELEVEGRRVIAANVECSTIKANGSYGIPFVRSEFILPDLTILDVRLAHNPLAYGSHLAWVKGNRIGLTYTLYESDPSTVAYVARFNSYDELVLDPRARLDSDASESRAMQAEAAKNIIESRIHDYFESEPNGYRVQDVRIAGELELDGRRVIVANIDCDVPKANGNYGYSAMRMAFFWPDLTQVEFHIDNYANAREAQVEWVDGDRFGLTYSGEEGRSYTYTAYLNSEDELIFEPVGLTMFSDND